jgi:hypothetical protein
LTFDTLQVTSTQLFDLNSYFAVDIPCDATDIIAVGIPFGQFVMPVTQRNTINNLTNAGPNGAPIPYGMPQNANNNQSLTFDAGYFVFQNINDLGENLGRLYGVNTGLVSTSYKIIRGRNQIQFSENFPSANVVIEWIDDGQCIDNASKIDLRAQSTIEAYSVWKMSKNRDDTRSPEAVSFGKEWRKTRSRISGTSLEDIRQCILRNYNGSPKN